MYHQAIFTIQIAKKCNYIHCVFSMGSHITNDNYNKSVMFKKKYINIKIYKSLIGLKVSSVIHKIDTWKNINIYYMDEKKSVRWKKTNHIIYQRGCKLADVEYSCLNIYSPTARNTKKWLLTSHQTFRN